MTFTRLGFAMLHGVEGGDSGFLITHEIGLRGAPNVVGPIWNYLESHRILYLRSLIRNAHVGQNNRTHTMPKPYDAYTLCDFFIRRGIEDTEHVSHMKLHKLLYFSQAWHLALYSQPILSENFYAWRLGPVVKSVFDHFRGNGAKDLKEPLEYAFTEEIEGGDIKFLSRMWELYGRFNAVELSNLSHEENGPWQTTWVESSGSGRERIDNEVMRQFYRAKLETGATH